MTQAGRSRKVPLLDLAAQNQRLSAELSEAVGKIFSTQQFILGPEVKALESEIAAYCQTAYAISCASGSDALLLALMALGVGPGDEVITTPYTFFATVSSIVRLGAKPVFVDIEPFTFNIEVGRIEEVITERTKAIIPIHLFGLCAEMSKLKEIADKRDIAIIEDAAQAIGATYKNAPAGSLGSVAAFSFYPSKNLGGAGDGGMLTTNDFHIAEKLFVLRAHGAKKKYFHTEVGINSRLDSLQAAILRVKLKYVGEWGEKRRQNAQTYRDLFTDTDLLTKHNLTLPQEIEHCRHIYNQFVIRVSDRDQLKDHLTASGIGTEIYYPLPLHLQPCFAGLGYREGDFPVSELAARQSLAIPIYPELSREDQEYVVESISAYYNC